jgi:hypothetical protein
MWIKNSIKIHICEKKQELGFIFMRAAPIYFFFIILQYFLSLYLPERRVCCLACLASNSPLVNLLGKIILHSIIRNIPDRKNSTKKLASFKLKKKENEKKNVTSFCDLKMRFLKISQKLALLTLPHRRI